MSIQLAHRLPSPAVFGLDAAAVAWTVAVAGNGGTVSAGRAVLVSALVAALKASGAWSQIDDLWLLTAEGAAQALTSLKQGRLATAVNSPTFTTDQGYAFDGATSYIDTGFVPSSHAVAMTGASMSIGAYERTNVGATTYAIGDANGTNQNLRLVPRSSGNQYVASLDSASTNVGSGITDSRGLTVANRTAGGAFGVSRNGGAFTTFTPGTNATVLPTLGIYIGAQNLNAAAANFRASTIGAAFVGGELAAQNVADLYAALQTFMTAIGANV